MNYEKSQNETEILSGDKQKLREMCRSLRKVEAPGDFDLKLKARIANAKPADFQPRFGFAFRYALPALALIMVLGLLLAYNSGFGTSPGDLIVAGDAPVETTKPALPQNSAISNFTVSGRPEPPNRNPADLTPVSQKLPKKPEPQTARHIIKTPKKNLREIRNNSGGGSRDIGFTGAKVNTPLIVPETMQKREEPNLIPVKEVLSSDGINADFENGKWKVKSVRANSPGESSGIKENDVIEAIDDQPVSAESVFNKTAGGKTITVTRDGEKSQIRLPNKK